MDSKTPSKSRSFYAAPNVFHSPAPETLPIPVLHHGLKLTGSSTFQNSKHGLAKESTEIIREINDILESKKISSKELSIILGISLVPK